MRRVLRFASGLAIWSSVLILGVLVISRLASDRWLWSQYLHWIPEELYVLGAGVLCLLAWSGARLFECGKRPLLKLAAIGWILAALHVGLIHWHLPNAFSHPQPGRLRLLNWNLTAIERDEQIMGPFAALAPDIAVLVNPVNTVHWSKIIADFPDPKALVWEGPFMILSHEPILRHGSVVLGIEGAISEGWKGIKRLDAGHAMFFELDTTDRLGRTTVVWVVDMPSDWRRSRWDMAGAAAAAIAAWKGPQIKHDPTGQVQGAPGGPGFPKPDIILGDFNTPRGAVSQRRIVGSMTDAFDEAGWGYAATWPDYAFHVPFPVLHLDHVFLAPWLRATRYEIIKPPFCLHRPQVVEISPAN